jgi:hypothetical protein
MELGEMSLHDLFKKDVNKLADIQIRKLAKDIALAIRDFHRGNKYKYITLQSEQKD